MKDHAIGRQLLETNSLNVEGIHLAPVVLLSQ